MADALRGSMDAAEYKHVTLGLLFLKYIRLNAGMLVSAVIHLGTRTVMEYLLSPVSKKLHETGREL